MPPTIRDVAKKAEVSVATVSRVLNQSAPVKEDTRQRVLNAIKESGFTSNAIARSLSTKKSVTIGVIVPAITNPVFAQSTRGIQNFSNAYGYSILLGNSDYSSDAEDRLIEVFHEKRVEGILLTCSNIHHNYVQRLKEVLLPTVLLYNTFFDNELNFVTINNYQAAYEIVEHLVKLGHRRIGMIAGRFDMSDRSLVRAQAFRACLKDNGIPDHPLYLIETDLSFEGGRRAMEILLDVIPPLTGIFCSNDFMAMGAMKKIREKGLGIPEDISIVGFDDIEMASYFSPELTTIRQPAYEMGLKGAELLFKISSGDLKGPQQILLEHKLVIRNSSGPAYHEKESKGGDLF